MDLKYIYIIKGNTQNFVSSKLITGPQFIHSLTSYTSQINQAEFLDPFPLEQLT